MKNPIVVPIFAALLSAGCNPEAVAPTPLETFPLTATITEANECTVTVLGKTYQSKGQVRGDVPANFVGTLKDESYHGFGCWVETQGSDGDLVVLFAGNAYQKPLAVGTYPAAFEIVDETPPNTSQVTFRSGSFDGVKLITPDGARGNVIVETTPRGGRLIRVDVDVFRYSRAL